MLPLQARVDLVAKAIKWYSAFPKAPALLEPHHQIAYCYIVYKNCRSPAFLFYFFFALVEARAKHVAIKEAAWLFQSHAGVTVGADMMQK